MRVLVVGNEKSIDEFKMKFGESHEYTFIQSHQLDFSIIENQDLVFDFLIDEDPEAIELYQDLEGLPVFINTPKISLAELGYFNEGIKCALFGFNGFPTFLSRSVLEISLNNPDDKNKLTSICNELNTDFSIVKDRVGMVTPRIISMIINEAYYTVQEGTASRSDIDMGMKMGTNYPFGPFEWCDKIGIRNIYELLEAIYDDTKDERYKICPLLKNEYLLANQ